MEREREREREPLEPLTNDQWQFREHERIERQRMIKREGKKKRDREGREV